MRQFYWNQDKPDADDRELAEAISAGLVPPGCLLGGALVARFIEQSEDPCAWCTCPARDRCGGRAQEHNKEITREPPHPMVRGVAVSEAGARKLQRRAWTDRLDEWIRDEKARRGER